MKVRPAVSSDIPTLVEFQIAMAKETENLDLDACVLKRGITAVLNDKQKARYFVVENEKHLCGCYMVTPEWSDWRAGYFIWLQSVYVAPDFRRKGVFRMMYEYMREIVLENIDYRGIRLYVDKDNEKAIKAYMKMEMEGSNYEMLEWVSKFPMIFLLFASVFYIVFILLILSGVLRLTFSERSSLPDEHLPEVDVLIPYRNESFRIAPLLRRLGEQNFPLQKARFIFINDHSTDDSAIQVQAFSFRTRFSVMMLDLPEGCEGKKSALEFGLVHVKSEYVLFTDADCSPDISWIKEMLSFAKTKKSELVLGPVEMTGVNHVSRFQSAEFLSLQAVTIGTAGLGNAILSNAANLLVRTDCLKELENPFQREISSGDDVFLMEQLKNENKIVDFCLHPGALVKTPASNSWHELFIQRARWLSKTRKYSLNFSLIFAGTFGLLQFVYLFVIVGLLIKGEFLLLALFVFLKLVFDFLLMGQTAFKTGSKIYVGQCILLSVLYPVWTIVSSITAFIIRPKWKDRPVKV